HEAEDVIAESELDERCGRLTAGQPLVVVAVCRHQSIKGMDFLISAIALLAAQGLAVETRIYGQGDMTEAWRALACRLGVAGRGPGRAAAPPPLRSCPAGSCLPCGARARVAEYAESLVPFARRLHPGAF